MADQIHHQERMLREMGFEFVRKCGGNHSMWRHRETGRVLISSNRHTILVRKSIERTLKDAPEIRIGSRND